MRYLEGHQGPVYSLAYSHEGDTLASSGKDGSVRCWDAGCGQVQILVATTANGPAIHSVNFHPNGTIAWGDDNGEFRCQNRDQQKLLWTLSSDLGPVSSTTFVNSGRQWIVGFGDRINSASSGGVWIVDATSGKIVQRIGTPNGTWAVAGDHRGKRILWGGGDRRVTVGDLAAQDRWMTPAHSREVRALALSPNSKLIAVADDYIVRLYSTDSRLEQRQLTGHKGRVEALAFTQDGRNLISGAWDKQIKIWDVATGSEIAAHDWGVGNIRAISLAPDGLSGAVAGDRGIIALWDMDN